MRWPRSRPADVGGADFEHTDAEPFESAFSDDYVRFDSLADLFRQIGHDERVHKQESLAQAAASRFR